MIKDLFLYVVIGVAPAAGALLQHAGVAPGAIAGAGLIPLAAAYVLVQRNNRRSTGAEGTAS